jgi:hypothetical protein
VVPAARMSLDWIPKIADLHNKGTEALKTHFLKSIRCTTGESISTLVFCYSDETMSPPLSAYMNSSPNSGFDLIGKDLGSIQF